MKLAIACLAAVSLVLSACSTTTQTRPDPAVVGVPASPTAKPRPAVVKCPDCGRVERIEAVQGVRATAGGGVVLGGVVGGVISEKPKTSTAPASKVAEKTYRLTIRMDDGRRLVIHQNLISANLRVGSMVRVSNGRVMLLR